MMDIINKKLKKYKYGDKVCNEIYRIKQHLEIRIIMYGRFIM